MDNVVVLVLIALVAMIVLQNTGPVDVRLFFVLVESVPLMVVMLLCLALGMVAVGLPLWSRLRRTRTRLRTVEIRNEMLETAAARREPPSTPGV